MARRASCLVRLKRFDEALKDASVATYAKART